MTLKQEVEQEESVDEESEDEDDSSYFQSISAYYDFIYLIMSNDNEDDKISHFSFYNTLKIFLRNFQTFNPNCEKEASPNTVFEKLAPYLFEKFKF